MNTEVRVKEREIEAKGALWAWGNNCKLYCVAGENGSEFQWWMFGETGMYTIINRRIDYPYDFEMVRNQWDWFMQNQPNTSDLDNIKVTITVDLDNDIIKRHFFKNDITVSLNELILMVENHTNAMMIRYKKQGFDDVKIDKLLSRDEHIAYLNDLIDVIKKRIQKKLVETSLGNKKINMYIYHDFAKILTEYKNNNPIYFVSPLLETRIGL